MTPCSLRTLSLAGLAACAFGCGGDSLAPEFSKVAAEVTVIRDKSGVPHIYGKTESDVGYAVGYEHARDRLFQMDLLRRMGQGRMSEVFGELYKGTNYFDQDWLLRAVGFTRAAEETTAWMRRNDRATFTLLSAYAAGVNAFIADARAGRGGAALPYGFRASELDYTPDAWRVEDSVLVGKLQTWALSSSVSYELLSTLIQYVLDADTLNDLVTYAPPEPTFVLPDFPAPGGAFGRTGAGLQSVDAPPGPLPPRIVAPRGATDRSEQRESSSPITNRNSDIALAPFGRAAGQVGERLVRDVERPQLDAAQLREVADRVVNALRALSPFGLQAGSNNWVVSGAHTRNGKPILCNDPHLPLSSPANFYLLHMSTAEHGGTLDVAGVSFPGAPVVVIGHNRRIAWGATVARGDVADIFGEKLTADRKRTLHAGVEEPIVERTEVIRVRLAGAPRAPFEERMVKLLHVPRHGPVLPAEATLPPELANADLFSFAWTGLGVTNEIGAFVRLNRAADVAGFVGAMKHISTGAQNFVYADADGHIAYFARARYPLRKTLDRARPPWFVVPGDGAHDWTAQNVPDDRVPQALDPSAGFIATANNDPVGVTRGGDPLGGPFYLGPLYDPGYRAWRITTELQRLIARGAQSPAQKITPEDMKTLQLDTYSRLAERLRVVLPPALTAAKAGAPALAAYANDAALDTAVARLGAWDLRTTRESPDAALFHLWAAYYGSSVLRDDIGSTIFDRAVEASLDVLLRPLVFLSDNPRTPSGRNYFDNVRTQNVVETRDEMALSALRKALDHGARLFGTADVSAWRWAQIHTVTFTNAFGGALDVGPVGIQGGVGTVDVADPALISKDGSGAPPDVLKTVHGANLRMVVAFDAAGVPGAEVIIPGGQSGVPGQPHFADQVDDWANGRFRKLRFKRSDVDADVESTVTFKVGATAASAF